MSLEIKGQLNNVRISPRKMRLVANAIKGLNALEAKTKLVFVVKRSSHPILKLLNSVMANARNNFKLDSDNLIIKKIFVDEGRKLKRVRPKGFGSTSPIQKKTSHISIVLGE